MSIEQLSHAEAEDRQIDNAKKEEIVLSVNPKKGTITILLDSKEYILTPCGASMEEIDGKCERCSTKMFHELQVGNLLKTQEINTIIWAGIRGGFTSGAEANAPTYAEVRDAVFKKGVIKYAGVASLFLAFGLTGNMRDENFTEQQQENLKS